MNFNTKTKKILAISLSLLLVASAIFFAVYGAVGHTYRYSKRNLDKFVSDLHYTGIDISGVELKEVDEKAIQQQIAKLLASKASSTVSSAAIADGVDLVLVCYYGVDSEGNLVTAPSTMDPTKAVKVQLCSSERLYEIFGDVITGISPKDFSYNVYGKGSFPYGDVAFISYLPKTGDKVESKQVAFNETDVDALLGAGAYAALTQVPVGTSPAKAENATHLVFGTNEYESVVIDWVARTEFGGTNDPATEDVDESKILPTDTVLAQVTTKNSTGATVTYSVMITPTETKIFSGVNPDAELPAAVLATIKESAYKGTHTVTYQKAEGLTEFDSNKTYYTYNDTDNKYVEVPAGEAFDAAKTYYTNIGEHKISIESIVRPGATDLTEAMKGLEKEFTFADDATDKGYKDVALAGKTVTYRVFPIGVYEVDLNAKNIVTLNTTLTSEKGAALIKAHEKYTAYEKAETALKTALASKDQEYNAYYTALRTYKDSTAENPDKTALEAARAAIIALDAAQASDRTSKMDAMEKAYDEMKAEIKKYDADKNVADITSFGTYFDDEAKEILPTETEDRLKEQNLATYKSDVAKLLWEEIVAAADVKAPGKALRLAKKEQMDMHKQAYYTKGYLTHKTFKKYIAATLGAEYKDVVKADAEAAVKELVLIYLLADKLDIEINDTVVNEYYQDSSEMYIYYYYYYGTYPEQFETAYVFDKVMGAIIDMYELKEYPEA